MEFKIIENLLIIYHMARGFALIMDSQMEQQFV